MPPVSFDRHAKHAFPLFVELQSYAADMAASTHTHDCVELVYVVKGSGVHHIDGEPFPLIRGDLYVIDEGAEHMFHCETDFSFYNILLKVGLYDAVERERIGRLSPLTAFLLDRHGRVAPGTRPKTTIPPPHSDELARLLERTTAEIAAKQPGWESLAKALFTEFLVTVCRLSMSGGSDVSDVGEGPVARALGCIHERYAERLTLDDLATVAGVSSGHLGEVFKERTGVTVHQYLNKLRVERARELLAQTDLSVTEICHRSGFEDSGYLTRVFKRATGLSPRAYRRTLATGKR
ncbi:MAG: helix-turn-helix transcriptional regulator [Planctomycetes bacterium]|nr:helix-turn-helix transcriptional regulator [Planctomycetota bacterium]